MDSVKTHTHTHTEAHKLLLVLSLGPVCVCVCVCVYSGSVLLADRKTDSLRPKTQQLCNRVFPWAWVGPL